VIRGAAIVVLILWPLAAVFSGCVPMSNEVHINSGQAHDSEDESTNERNESDDEMMGIGVND